MKKAHYKRPDKGAKGNQPKTIELHKHDLDKSTITGTRVRGPVKDREADYLDENPKDKGLG